MVDSKGFQLLMLMQQLSEDDSSCAINSITESLLRKNMPATFEALQEPQIDRLPQVSAYCDGCHPPSTRKSDINANLFNLVVLAMWLKIIAALVAQAPLNTLAYGPCLITQESLVLHSNSVKNYSWLLCLSS